MSMEPNPPDSFSEKNEANASSEAKLHSAVPSSIRQFSPVTIKAGSKLTINSILTGKPVQIRVRSMVDREKRILSKACDDIESKLVGTEYEEGIRICMKVTAFCSTNSSHLGAYSGLMQNYPIVIFNAQTFNQTIEEFRVTVLHELLHLIMDPGDPAPDSMDEAHHDILCYALLGLPIPMDHWMFKKYPHLLEKLQVVSK